MKHSNLCVDGWLVFLLKPDKTNKEKHAGEKKEKTNKQTKKQIEKQTTKQTNNQANKQPDNTNITNNEKHTDEEKSVKVAFLLKMQVFNTKRTMVKSQKGDKL